MVVVVVVVVVVVAVAVVVVVGVGVGICTFLAVGCCLSQVSLQTAAPTDMEMRPTPVTLEYLRTDCSHTMVNFVVLDFAWVLRLCVCVIVWLCVCGCVFVIVCF